MASCLHGELLSQAGPVLLTWILWLTAVPWWKRRPGRREGSVGQVTQRAQKSTAGRESGFCGYRQLSQARAQGGKE